MESKIPKSGCRSFRKELVRQTVLEEKEKPREQHEKSSGQSDSPTQYGTEKIEVMQYRAASVAGKAIKENHISRWKKTCRSDLRDKGKEKTDRKK